MTDISGIIIREHTEQKYIKKFPKIVPWTLLALGCCSIVYYYVKLLYADITIGWSMLILVLGFLATIASLYTMPTHMPEEYLIEVTPRMSAIDWLVVEKEFTITNEGLLLYRCRRKEWKHSDSYQKIS
jgi:hypothetical protein